MTPNNFRVKSGLTVGTTISGGNTSITGFVNATSTVNAAGLAVGTAFVANTTGAYHTGTINAAALSVGSSFVANSTGVFQTGAINATSFTTTNFSANSTLVNAVAINLSGQVNTATLYATTSANIAGVVQANSTGIWTTGTANASTLSVGTAFVANTTRVVIGTSTGLQANGGIGTAGQTLHSNGTTVYWAADDGITSIATANGLSGGTITSTGTLGVVTGSTLTVNTTGIHVNSTLNITDLVLSGNLTVSGTRTYVNTTTLDVGDNMVTLNADLGAAAPTQDAGIEVMRGTSANVQFMWDETNDRWSTNGQPIAVSSLLVSTNTATFGTAAYVVANGNFGVGTASPTEKFQIGGGNLYLPNATGNSGALVGVGSSDSFTMNTVTMPHYGLKWATPSGVAGVQLLASGYYGIRMFTGGAERINVGDAGTVTITANTTISGFANVSTSVNSALLTVGSSFIANTTGAYHTGTVNAASHTAGANFIANTTGVYHTGTINAASHTVGTTFVANSTFLTVGTSTPLNSGMITSSAPDGKQAITAQVANNAYSLFQGYNSGGTLAFQVTGAGNITANGSLAGVTTLAAGNTTISGWLSASSTRGAVATPTAGQNNSALYVTGSDTAYGLLFGTDPATGRGWIQAQRTDGTATVYSLRLNPAGGTTEFGAGYTEAEVANTAATGTWTMNCAAANFFELTLTGSITISPSNVPANGRVWSGTIVAKQDATGGRTITWPTGIKWPGGSAPPATTTANAIDIWSLMTYDGGSTWVGSLTVKNVA